MEYYAAKINENGAIAVDDSILVKGAESTYGSKILMGFKPLFSAEAVERLEKNGYLVSGKCHVGEFGLDLVGEFSHYAQEDTKLEGAPFTSTPSAAFTSDFATSAAAAPSSFVSSCA